MSETKFTRGIRNLILGDAFISSLVGTNVFNYYVPIEKSKVYPWIAFMVDLPEPQNNLSDESNDTIKSWEIPLSFYVCSSNPDEMLQLSYRLQDIFNLYQGEIENVSVDRIIFESYSSDWSDNPLTFYSSIEFRITCWDKPNFINTSTT